MEAFQYQAFDAGGQKVSGVLQADSPRQARAQLRAQGLLPSAVDQVHCRKQVEPRWSRAISATELSLMTGQMATLLAAGLTMEQTLNALIEQATRAKTQALLTEVKREITGGSSLAGALGSYEKSFPGFYLALVHGGEESGALPTVLQHLATYLDEQQAFKQKTALALLYPALVSAVAVIIVAALLIYVVPQVVQVFHQSRQSLPLLTRAMIALSDFLRGSWPYIFVIAIAAASFGRMALKEDGMQRRWHALLLRLPWLGGLILGINTSRFASTLSILVGGGVSLLVALQSSARVMTNRVLAEAIEDVILRVREGSSLARALGDTRRFPPLLVHLVASGERSGTLNQMLDRAARLERQGLEQRLAVFLTLLEPVMILVMGGIVLMIVLAILLPIIEINQLVR